MTDTRRKAPRPIPDFGSAEGNYLSQMNYWSSLFDSVSKDVQFNKIQLFPQMFPDSVRVQASVVIRWVENVFSGCHYIHRLFCKYGSQFKADWPIAGLELESFGVRQRELSVWENWYSTKYWDNINLRVGRMFMLQPWLQTIQWLPSSRTSRRQRDLKGK